MHLDSQPKCIQVINPAVQASSHISRSQDPFATQQPTHPPPSHAHGCSLGRDNFALASSRLLSPPVAQVGLTGSACDGLELCV